MMNKISRNYALFRSLCIYFWGLNSAPPPAVSIAALKSTPKYRSVKNRLLLSLLVLGMGSAGRLPRAVSPAGAGRGWWGQRRLGGARGWLLVWPAKGWELTWAVIPVAISSGPREAGRSCNSYALRAFWLPFLVSTCFYRNKHHPGTSLPSILWMAFTVSCTLYRLEKCSPWRWRGK